MAAPTISQRIALEGAEQIVAQLQNMGQAGQRAIAQLATASQATTSPLAGLSDAIDKVGKAVTDGGAKLSGFFNDLRGHLPTLQTFGTVLGVTITGGVTGAIAALVDFAAHAASAAADVGRSAQQVGFGVEAYQAWRFAAAAAGLEADKFSVTMGRFARAVEEADKAQNKAAASIAETLVTGLGKGQVVLQGVAGGFIQMVNAGKDLGTNVVRPLQLTAVQMDQLRLAAAQVRDVFARAGFGGSVEQIARQLLQMAQTSDKVREELRKLGVDFPAVTLEEAIKKVSDTTIDKFSKMGVAVKEIRDGSLQLRPVEDILADVADKFQKLPDGAQKTALAIELFGRSGRLLVPLLNEGREGVTRLMEEFARLGVTLDQMQTKTGIEQVRAWHEFETAISGVRTQVGIAFAPAITAVLQTFTGLIRDNVPAIKEWAASLASQLVPAVRDFITLLSGAQGPLQNDWLRDWAGGLQEFGSVAGSVLGLVRGEIVGIAAAIRDTKAEIQAIIDFLRTAASIISAIGDEVAGAAASGLPAGGGGENPSPFAGGGFVRGPGSATSDSILARLSDGEFVVNAAAVRRYGVRVLAALNAQLLPLSGFSLGGLAAGLGAGLDAIGAPGFAAGGLAMAGAPASGRHVLNLSIDGAHFRGLVAPADTFAALVRYSVGRQTSAAGQSPSWVR